MKAGLISEGGIKMGPSINVVFSVVFVLWVIVLIVIQILSARIKKVTGVGSVYVMELRRSARITLSIASVAAISMMILQFVNESFLSDIFMFVQVPFIAAIFYFSTTYFRLIKAYKN